MTLCPCEQLPRNARLLLPTSRSTSRHFVDVVKIHLYWAGVNFVHRDKSLFRRRPRTHPRSLELCLDSPTCKLRLSLLRHKHGVKHWRILHHILSNQTYAVLCNNSLQSAAVQSLLQTCRHHPKFRQHHKQL